MATKTNDNLYKLINDLRLEIKADILATGAATALQVGKLDARLDHIENKRIAPIEKDLEKLKIDSATGNVKLGALIFVGSSIVSSLVTFVTSKVLS